MKTNDRHLKWLLFILLGVILLIAGVLTALFRNTNQQAVKMTGQFAMVGGRPVIIKEGNVYEYGTNDIWKHLELTGEAKQIVRGEVLCVLNMDGSIYYGEELDLNEEGMPNLSAYSLYMADMALKLNKEEPFVYINQSIRYLNFRALLQNGDILYQGESEYDHYQMEEETPIVLSGSYILTTQGNVYFMNTEIDNGIVDPKMKCVYDGGDIVAISASETAARCLGLRENGKVISWSDLDPLKVTGWRNMVAIEQWFNYAVGLTDKGNVLYVDYSSSRTEAVNKALEQWTDVVQIAAGYNTIAGLKEDDSCYILDLTAFE